MAASAARAKLMAVENFIFTRARLESSKPSHFEPMELSCLCISLYTRRFRANSRPIVDAMLFVVIDWSFYAVEVEGFPMW